MLNKKKIMVVDDDMDIVESITVILESAGYEVVSADSGARCLDILHHTKPDLIIIDIMMETITEGFAVLHEIKSDPEYRTIPFIVISSIEDHTGFPVDKNFIEVGEFIKKPFQPGSLLESIEKSL